MEIFRFFNIAAAAILGFWNYKFITVERAINVEMRHHAEFCGDRPNRCRNIATFGFSKMAAVLPRWRLSAILDLWCTCLDHRQRVLGGLYRCVKFGWNWSFVVLKTCEFQYYASLAWKCLFTHFLLGFTQMMSLIVLTPKRTILGLNHVIRAINREYRLSGSSWALVREKRQDKTRQEKRSQKVIFHLFVEKTHWSDLNEKNV